MLALIRSHLPEVLRAFAPLLFVAAVLQLALLDVAIGRVVAFVVGSTLAVIGMALLFAGIDMGILPMGRFIGAALPRQASRTLILVVAFALGFATTVAEPDVLVLAAQVEAVTDGALGGQPLVYVVGAGVGVFIMLALVRIIYGFSMVKLLIGVYALILLLSLVAPARFVALAFDAGSVTTGVLTAPVILALALGFNSVLGERTAMADGFGLLGLASVGPILTLLLMSLLG